jgi:hypothetical protein
MGAVHAGSWFENLRKRDHLEHIGVIGRILLRGTCKK